MDGSLWYPSPADILAVHDAIISEYPNTMPGVRDRGTIEFVVQYIKAGQFHNMPVTIHSRAFHLLRLLVVNHPFVDGNKRTALNSTVIFYFLNGHRFEYDKEVKDILKQFATDESNADSQETLEYLTENTHPIVLEDEITKWRDDLIRYGISRLSEETSDPNG